MEWLHRKTEWDEPKELEVSYQGIEIEPFLDLLKDAFNAANEPCSYSVKLYEGREDGGRERKHYLNKRTSECLQVRLTRFDLCVERGPLNKVLQQLKNDKNSV
ncbi:hypothetical protein AAVH_40398 [Aphelenchoides avenae]|nr:hypothetical protein AAVH_40398 [Aphelenchus avenae]